MFRSIWPIGQRAVGIIDQTGLPYEFRTLELESSHALAAAIASMRLRGAPLIGVAAAYGIALATNGDAGDERRIIIAAPNLGRAIGKPAWLSEGVRPRAANTACAAKAQAERLSRSSR